MKKEMRKCAVCGKKFTPKTANASVCSDKCRKALKAKRDKARKAKKAVVKAAPVPPKKATKKVVKAVCKEKVALPKKPLVKAAVVPPTKTVGIHIIKPGEIIKFDGFTPERVLSYAVRLAVTALCAKNRGK